MSWAGSQSWWRVERKEDEVTVIGTNWEWRKHGRRKPGSRLGRGEEERDGQGSRSR